MERIRYGIVDTGYFGAELGRALTRMPEADVITVFDPDNGSSRASPATGGGWRAGTASR